MPIYEYTCKSCDQKFDKLVRAASRDDKVECPSCGSKQTARALSVFAVSSESPKSAPANSPMCGRCGGPGPCAMD